MAFSGGTFSRLYSWASDQSNGIKIRADRMDAEMDGMATGLSTCLLKDGTQTATARIPFAAGIKMGGQSIQLDPANSSAITAGTNNIIIVSANGADQVKFTDGTIEPATDNDIDLGTASKEFKNAYFDGTVTTDALTLGTSTSVTSVDVDLSSVSASDDTLASAKAIKTYVDGQVTAQDLDYQGDSGGAQSIDLDSQTLTLAGGEGIDTAGSGTTLTISAEDASTSNKGVASFSSDNFAVSSGAVTIKSGGVDLTDEITGTLPVANGGTGATSLTDGGILLGSGTGAITAMSALGDGVMIVGDGSGDPVAESGATLRTSIGVGAGDSPTFSALTLSGGNLLFSSASKGVYLGVTTATAANLLDDYEEGDWTPTIGQGATASSDAAYNSSFSAGQYIKTGSVVHCTATLRLTDKGTQSGAISVCGLPFASANNVKYRATWSLWLHGASDVDLTGDVTGTLMAYQAHNTSHIIFRVKDPANTSAENVEFADISDTVYLQISGSYVAA
jgi:hypothetical protein